MLKNHDKIKDDIEQEKARLRQEVKQLAKQKPPEILEDKEEFFRVDTPLKPSREHLLEEEEEEEIEELLEGIGKKMRGDEVEQAIAKSIETLSSPQKIEYFTDLSSEQAGLFSLGIQYGNSIGFSEYVQMLYHIAEFLVSKKRLGRKELKEMGTAGVQRTSEKNMFQRLTERFEK